MDMKFNPMGGIYHKPSGNVVKLGAKFNTADVKTLPLGEQKTDKADKVEISPAATQQYELYKMTKSVMKEVDAADISQKVQDIKARMQNDTYQIPMDELAGAILSRWTV